MSRIASAASFFPRTMTAIVLSSRIGTTNKLPSSSASRSRQYRVYIRILSNLLAAAVILISLITMGVLLSEGMFNRLVITWYYQDNTDYWADYGASCELGTDGFVNTSCSPIEVNTTETVAAWTAIGAQLAMTWQADSTSPIKVTTCLVGGTPDVGWVALQFIGGYDDFPSCNPSNGSQLIAGIAMVEAANLDTVYPDGAYLLSMFGDASMHEATTYWNTDGTSNTVVANITRVLVGRDGSTQHYETGINSATASRK
ncbi:hypothetical protein SDRG_04847 [Saprolegnia diclina VS20]|uniref:Uncharacterized protein n=1 Tax=Saprolegnia diclina (strain VS20) TaxID=1156394 RepID=T0RYX2_SAPDV|nr:hypothetical protein SDRG_04847 [Saprolegnia diclina VS20]EQC37823.1 hypothetical protein SDRG_04847 [Saprolegnia diclina VS20]|eukprot:XP_008608756.1 hypothetical protein SDRG_04847 [Saprolegnia diclina VS20]